MLRYAWGGPGKASVITRNGVSLVVVLVGVRVYAAKSLMQSLIMCQGFENTHQPLFIDISDRVMCNCARNQDGSNTEARVIGGQGSRIITSAIVARTCQRIGVSFVLYISHYLPLLLSLLMYGSRGNTCVSGVMPS